MPSLRVWGISRSNVLSPGRSGRPGPVCTLQAEGRFAGGVAWRMIDMFGPWAIPGDPVEWRPRHWEPMHGDLTPWNLRQRKAGKSLPYRLGRCHLGTTGSRRGLLPIGGKGTGLSCAS